MLGGVARTDSLPLSFTAHEYILQVEVNIAQYQKPQFASGGFMYL